MDVVWRSHTTSIISVNSYDAKEGSKNLMNISSGWAAKRVFNQAEDINPSDHCNYHGQQENSEE